MTEAAAGPLAITGASGFVGAAIARHLAAAGWRLRLLVRRGSENRLPTLVGAEIITGSLADRGALERLLDGAQALVHGAGAVRGASYADFERVNVAGTQALLDAAGPTLRMLHISSLAARHPRLSHYAASKWAGERLVMTTLAPARRVVLRPPAIYGPGDRELRPLLDAMWRGWALLPGPPQARFSLLHVDDLARAVGRLLAGEAGWGAIHEPDDGQPGGHGWQDLLDAIGRLRGARVRAVHVPGWLLSALGAGNELLSRLTHRPPMLSRGKARELRWPDWVAAGNVSLAACGWRPAIDLDRGLRDTLTAAADRRQSA
ncbi:NAD(P)-dependent oxidoreductase [Immundisolibacter sp.]|uniref:NAD-dependent epimerase/dehydratase family protein n=1 Tax=Immundisolibacter sp. TaxID=1934948 RepID=UPI0026044EC2|nr:NAD-dependent epimerase/dehydratase family protein [Immundisolibacter sp.]MDD3650130.1 SDR family NAD(P)-dependent oxidoreductase [Immundisolibacter sp.]